MGMHEEGAQAVMDLMSKEQGALELTLLNAEYDRDRFETLMVEGLNRGIPAEIMTRLEGIWSASQKIAGEVVAIGKIVVSQIFAFLRAHPAITVGIALGAAVTSLCGGIPLFGVILAPLVGKLSMLYGAGVGAAFESSGSLTSDPLVAAQGLAYKFYELLRNIFLAVTQYLTPA